MRPHICSAAVLSTILLMAQAAPAADVPVETGYRQHIESGVATATALSGLTETAISPLFGVTVRSAVVYFRTDENVRDALPWYYQPEFWVSLSIILVLLAAKGTVCEAMPFLKKPLDAAALIAGKPAALLAMPFVLGAFADSIVQPTLQVGSTLSAILFPSAQASIGSIASDTGTALAYAVCIVAGAVAYLAVWLVADTVDVFILLSPFPGVDAALKGARLAFIGALAALTATSPLAGMAACVIIIIIALYLAGWSFRLSVFGWVFAFDIILWRNRFEPDGETGAAAFSGSGLRGTVPMRTYGYLRRGDDGNLAFSYRPFLVGMRKTAAIADAPQRHAVGEGLLYPALLHMDAADRRTTVINFPPRYRGSEEALRAAFGAAGVEATMLLRGVRSCWNWITGRGPSVKTTAA